jgi:tetratricopeptide (TPR) repeat protein
MVYQLVLWTEPFQSIVDAHRLGEKAGRQAGDFLYATLNCGLSISTSYVAGQSLDIVRDKQPRSYIRKMQRQNSLHGILLNSQILVLKEGVASLDADGLPTERDFPSNKNFLLGKKIHNTARVYLFRQLDNESLDINTLISSTMLDGKNALRPLLLMGIFFEGLVCFQLARQTNNDERTKWMEKGETILSKMKLWNQHSTWNFENKMLLLEAEKMHNLGIYDRAATLYESSIRSAREHKFIHEEAIASELAGVLYYERRLHEKALNFLMHSVRSYEKWGALAVAKRVETFIASIYGEDYKQLELNEDALSSVFASGENDSKKRQVRE